MTLLPLYPLDLSLRLGHGDEDLVSGFELPEADEIDVQPYVIAAPSPDDGGWEAALNLLDFDFNLLNLHDLVFFLLHLFFTTHFPV